MKVEAHTGERPHDGRPYSTIDRDPPQQEYFKKHMTTAHLGERSRADRPTVRRQRRALANFVPTFAPRRGKTGSKPCLRRKNRWDLVQNFWRGGRNARLRSGRAASAHLGMQLANCLLARRAGSGASLIRLERKRFDNVVASFAAKRRAKQASRIWRLGQRFGNSAPMPHAAQRALRPPPKIGPDQRSLSTEAGFFSRLSAAGAKSGPKFA